MLKHFFAAVLFAVAGIIQSPAQDTIRMYLNENFEMAGKKEKAVYVRESLYRKGIYHITDKYPDGRKIVSGEYSSIVPRIEHGYFKYYNVLGEIYAEGYFNRGNISGKWIYYDKLGHDTVNYHAAEKIAALSPTIAASQPNPVPVNNAFIDYVHDHLHYPARALDLPGDKQIAVKLVFSGRSAIPEIDESPHKDFNFEICRVILEAPDSFFRPGGDTSSAFFIQLPVNFNYPLTIDTSSTAFDFVTEPASFQRGDINKFSFHVQKNVENTPEALPVKAMKKATVQFRVRYDGKVDQVAILRSTGLQSLDDAIVHQIKNAPDWIPAKNGNVVVSQRFVMPIVITP